MIAKRWKGGIYAHFALLFPLFICFDVSDVEACVLCENIDRTAALSPIPGYEFITDCGSLQDLLPYAIDPGSSSCGELQRMGTMCGCQSMLAPGVKPCTLCDMDNAALDMAVRLKAEDVQPYSTGLALLVDQITPTCQMVQAYLDSIPANTQECSSFTDELLAGQCGCASNVTKDDDEEVELCQICSGKNDVFAVPERDVTGLVKMLGADIFFPTSDNITCSNVYDTLSSKPANHLLCQREAKGFFQGVCECPWTSQERQCAETLHCNVDSFTPDLRLDYLPEQIGYPFTPTCQELLWAYQGVSEDTFDCFAASGFVHVCGCGIRKYLGATTEVQQAALAWTLRMAGLLSAIGSSLILWDVFVVSKKRNRNRRLTMLHQLVCGMSIFDVFSSIGNIFSTLPILDYRYFESASTPFPTGVYGAKGNAATCTAQGFFLQLGYTSAFYNLVLTVYYVLVIKKGMRETQLQRLKYWFHVPTLLAGFGLAFAGIPYYDNIFLFCHIPPAVEQSSWWTSEEGAESLSLSTEDSNDFLTVFSIVPISIVFVVGGFNMIVIYHHVSKQDRTANRWRMGNRLAHNSPDAPTSGQSSSSWSKLPRPRKKSGDVAPSNRLSKEVWWQAVFYMGSFLMAWPIYFYGTLNTLDEWENFPFWIACSAMFPLQGFWNAIVYFRPRLFAYFRAKVRERIPIPRNSERTPTSNLGKASTSASGGNIGTDNFESNVGGQGTPNELHQDEKRQASAVREADGQSSSSVTDKEGQSSAVRKNERLPSYFSRIDMVGSAMSSSKMESIHET
eukprot:scaffold2058_cov115-Cylindrotheca_fusiformis.AAC.3